jgi:hypothetical protein
MNTTQSTAGETWDLPKTRPVVTDTAYSLRTTPPLEQIASRLIRQSVEAGEYHGSAFLPGDQDVMDWAWATAGYRMDPHWLWDWDLLSTEDHVHRCLTHRHEGPNTRGLTR